MGDIFNNGKQSDEEPCAVKCACPLFSVLLMLQVQALGSSSAAAPSPVASSSGTCTIPCPPLDTPAVYCQNGFSRTDGYYVTVLAGASGMPHGYELVARLGNGTQLCKFDSEFGWQTLWISNASCPGLVCDAAGLTFTVRSFCACFPVPSLNGEVSDARNDS
jgi:hypothetical protein